MYGLLAPEDKQQALFQGLGGLGMGLLAGSAPSTTPKGLLGGVGQGLAGFNQGMQGHVQNVQRNKMAEVQMADLEQRRRDAETKRTARENLLNIDPTKLSDPSMLPQLMAASDDPASTLVAWNKSNQKPGPLSSIGKLQSDFQNGILPEGIYQAGLNKATSTQPLVNLNNTAENEESKVVGKGYGEQFNALQNANISAQSIDAMLDNMEPLIEQVSSGNGAGAALGVKSFMKRINVDPTSIGLADDAAPAEVLQSLSNLMVLKLRGAEGMPASGFSDADRAFLEAIPPSLGTTKEGNRLLVQMLRKKNQRIRDRAVKAQEWRQKYGTFAGFDAHYTKDREPIFNEQDVQRLIAVSQSQNPPPQQFGPLVPAISAGGQGEPQPQQNQYRPQPVPGAPPPKPRRRYNPATGRLEPAQ